MTEFGGLPSLSDSEQSEENSPPAKKKSVTVCSTYEKAKEFAIRTCINQIGWHLWTSPKVIFSNFHICRILTFFV